MPKQPSSDKAKVGITKEEKRDLFYNYALEHSVMTYIIMSKGIAGSVQVETSGGVEADQ